MNDSMLVAKIGNIYQIIPGKKCRWGGQLVVATEIMEWGIQGYLLLDRPDEGALTRFKGRAYLRPKWDELFLVGFIEWMLIDIEEKGKDEN